MRVLLVTTWGEACGIAEHSRYLIDAVRQAAPEIEIVPDAGSLDPHGPAIAGDFDITHFNYHAALHSRWTPEAIRRHAIGFNRQTVVTYHDTGVPNSDQCKSVIAACDAAVVHEPFDDLPAEKTHYWRMGVPAPAVQPYHFGARADWLGGDGRPALFFKAYRQQPVVGTIGFPFAWKCQLELARTAASVGWGFACVCQTASLDYVAELVAANPDCYIRTDFVPSEEAIQILAACDATAFPYVTHNTGQSGAILQGIAARKPVLAFWTCRQFRSLFEGNFGNEGDPMTRQVRGANPKGRAIWWVETFDDIALTLQRLQIGPVDPGTVALAHRESWANVGKKYAKLFRELVS